MHLPGTRRIFILKILLLNPCTAHFQAGWLWSLPLILPETSPVSFPAPRRSPPAREPTRAALINLSALTAGTQATSQTSGKSVIKSLALSPGEFKGKPWILIKLEALQEKASLFF